MTETLRIDEIVVGERLRVANDLSKLMESIATLGLLNPITVTMQHQGIGGLESREAPVLVAGLRRLKACEALGYEEIEANVLELYDLDLELAEIDENLVREDLTALERGEQLERRKWIYEQKYPQTRAGVAGGKARQGSATEQSSFAENTAESIGKTERTVQKDIAAVSGIPQSLRNELRNTKSANNRDDLKALSQRKDQPHVQRDAVAAVAEGRAESLREALRGKKTKSEPTRTQADAALDQLAKYLLELGADAQRLKILFTPLKAKNPMCAKILWRMRQSDAA